MLHTRTQVVTDDAGREAPCSSLALRAYASFALGTLLGIYALEGDTLEICVGDERSTKFTTSRLKNGKLVKEGAGRILFVFSRKKG